MHRPLKEDLSPLLTYPVLGNCCDIYLLKKDVRREDRSSLKLIAGAKSTKGLKSLLKGYIVCVLDSVNVSLP